MDQAGIRKFERVKVEVEKTLESAAFPRSCHRWRFFFPQTIAGCSTYTNNIGPSHPATTWLNCRGGGSTWLGHGVMEVILHVTCSFAMLLFYILFRLNI